jgi:hypothetical protein
VSTCGKGHTAVERTSRGKWVCRECAREAAREKDRLIGSAARHAGLTRDEYKARHGQTRAAAEAVLAGPAAEPRPDTCRNGHPRTPENTGWKQNDARNGGPTRYCTACRRDRDAAAWATIADAAAAAGMSTSEWVRQHGRKPSAAANTATLGTSRRRPSPDDEEARSRRQRAREARDQIRAEALATWTHVATLDPDQRDWDGLSVLALCSCGWRETHATRDDARRALTDHTAARLDARQVHGDRVDHHRQEPA